MHLCLPHAPPPGAPPLLPESSLATLQLLPRALLLASTLSTADRDARCKQVQCSYSYSYSYSYIQLQLKPQPQPQS